MRLTKGVYLPVIFSVICIIASIVTWIIFPGIYKTSVESNLVFKQKTDESLGYSAFMFSKPPIKNVMKFYFFNLTNVEEMKYEAAQPRLVETGAYAVYEIEHKKYLKFNDDGTQVFYENYKTYKYNYDDSCDTCNFRDLITIPNPTEIGAAADIMDPQYGIGHTGKLIVSIGLLLLGEYPFVTQPIGDILFDGYNDALLSAAHSDLVTIASGILNGGRSIIPIPVPAMRKMGFFIGYNGTNDEHYWVKTGKGDADGIGEIVSWGGRNTTPESWWTTPQARMINGSDTGSFNKPQLKKDDVLPFWNSFMCRSFNKRYLEESTVHHIPCYVFSVGEDEYDSTLEANKGFRYRNVEKTNYYPDWPSCPNLNASKCDPSRLVDCSLKANLCDDCCQGSFVNGTYLLPPGIFPLVCYPGHLTPTPFAVVYSPPHFVYSPAQVTNSVVGLKPDMDKHRPMMYDHEVYSGMITQVRYRLMVSMPTTRSGWVAQNGNLPTSVIPLFWEDSHTTLTDHTYHMIWLGFVFVPKIVTAVKYFLLAVGLCLIAVATLFYMRSTRHMAFQTKIV